MSETIYLGACKTCGAPAQFIKGGVTKYVELDQPKNNKWWFEHGKKIQGNLCLEQIKGLKESRQKAIIAMGKSANDLEELKFSMKHLEAHNTVLVGAMKDILSMIEAIPFKCESLDQLSSFVTQNLSNPPIEKYKGLLNIATTATDLYDNRLGWSEGRNPYAPPEFWDKLGAAIKTYQDLQEKE